MWGSEQQEAFERDGVVTLRGAFDADVASRMSDAVWGHVDRHGGVRRDDRATWPTETWHGISFKRLKRHGAFRAVLASPSVGAALDGIFGPGGWTPSGGGAQILFTFPDTTPGQWRVPHALWHMDSGFARRVQPPHAVKLFSVVEALPPRGGATMVLAGTPNLVADYARSAPDEHRDGHKANWNRFLRTVDPRLGAFSRDDGDPGRNDDLARPFTVGAQPVELRELGGEPGDVHVTHINCFHSGSPNANDRPRLLVTHLVSPVDTGVHNSA